MLAVEKGAARNTLAAYAADLADFAAFAAPRRLARMAAADDMLAAYMQSLHPLASARTQARRLSCLRGFFRFLGARACGRTTRPAARCATPAPARCRAS